MYNSFQISFKYLYYWLGAQNGKGHGIHSPLVYSFVQKVLKHHSVDFRCKEIELLRKSLCSDHSVIELEDYGAGSSEKVGKQRAVKHIARKSLKSPRYARLLYRLVKFLNAKDILELGTSLGVTTAYLATAAKEGKVTTIEGASAVAHIAANNFLKLEIPNIELIQGAFDQQLPELLRTRKQPPDLVFLDGNHTYEATIRYFNLLLPVIDADTVIVFDDIHWSKGMEKAWKEICAHPSVTLTIDVFFLGFVFFRKSQLVPQHFTIRF